MRAHWPRADAERLTVASCSLAIQINGKTREVIEVPVDTVEEEAFQLAQVHPRIQKLLSDKSVVKKIHVKNRILNLIVKEIER